MIQFFSMIASFLSAFLTFFDKFRTFNNSASILTNFRLWSRKALLIGALVFIVLYVAVLVAFFYFMIDSIVSLYNLISDLFDRIASFNNGGSDPIIQGAMFFLNVTGVASGLNAIFPFIASALTFRLAQKLYKSIIRLNHALTDLYLRVTEISTAA